MMQAACSNIPLEAEVVEWQTRTFEGRVAQAVRVQVPPSAPPFCEGTVQVVVWLDGSLVIPSSTRLISVDASFAFDGSRRVFSCQFAS